MNYKHTFVERSNDGINWKNIAKVSDESLSLDGEGIYIDSPPFSGIWYYRIHLKDDELGQTHYSNSYSVDFEYEEELLIYPNPTSGIFYIDGIPLESIVKILDIHGNQLRQFSLNSNRRSDISFLPSGIYLLKIVMIDGISISRKIILQH